MKNPILQNFLIALMLGSAFFSWFSVDRAIRIPDSSTWVVPMLWFSLFAMSIFLMAVLIREKQALTVALVVAFSFSLLFAPNPFHFLFLLLGLLFAKWGIRNIQRDLGLNVKISLWKSLWTGKMQILFALTMLISSQYFFTLGSIDGQKNIPRFDVSGSMIKMIMPILGIANPAFKGMSEDGLTVDQWLLTAQKENGMGGGLGAVEEEFIEAQLDAKLPPGIPAGQREILKQEAMKKMTETQGQLSQKNKDLILVEMRKQFSQSVSQDLKGDEKIAEVLASVVSNKMNEVMQTQLKGGGTVESMLPLVYASILFLTIFSLGSLLSRIWFLLIIMIFSALVKTGVVKIGKELIEKESIQY
ncbi:MAG: hypothetical protein ACD_8C00039G0002 [uncultured bacterium]|nr:MAG: hypothetical protein ACD_8C00039G0002 [uncultured bacterium]